MDTKKLFTFFAEKVNPKLKNARLLAGLNQPKGPIHFLVKHVSPATKAAKEQRKQTILRFSLGGISFIDWPSEKVDDKKAEEDFAAAKTYEWPRIVRFDYYAALREFQFDYDENTTTDARGRKKYPKFRFYTTEGDDIQKHLTKIMDVLTGKEKNDGSYTASSSRHSASISASTDTKDRSASVSEEKAAKKEKKGDRSGTENKERLDSSASQDEAKPKKEKKPKKIVIETAENPAPVEADQEIQPAEKDPAPKDKSEKKKKSKAMEEVAGEKAVEEEKPKSDLPAQEEAEPEPKPELEPEPEPEQKKSKKDKKKHKSSSPDEAAEPAPVAEESPAEPEPEPEKKHKKKDKKKSEE